MAGGVRVLDAERLPWSDGNEASRMGNSPDGLAGSGPDIALEDSHKEEQDMGLLALRKRAGMFGQGKAGRRRRFFATVGFCAILLASTVPAASAHTGGRFIRTETVQQRLEQRSWILMAICAGQGRAANPGALPIMRRYKHFGCVLFPETNQVLCARAHVLASGRVRLGTLFDGKDPATPPSACGPA